MKKEISLCKNYGNCVKYKKRKRHTGGGSDDSQTLSYFRHLHWNMQRFGSANVIQMSNNKPKAHHNVANDNLTISYIKLSDCPFTIKQKINLSQTSEEIFLNFHISWYNLIKKISPRQQTKNLPWKLLIAALKLQKKKSLSFFPYKNDKRLTNKQLLKIAGSVSKFLTSQFNRIVCEV